MYERFTADARKVVTLAQDEARGLGHGAIGPEHVLLGLLGAPGAAGRVLGDLGLTAERGRAEVEQVAGRGARMTAGAIPFTPRAREVVEGAVRQAMSLGHEEVGTEHVLLALVAERDGVAGRVLEAVAHPGVVRDAVLRTLDEAPAEAAGSVAEAPAGTAPAVAAAPDAVTIRLGDDVAALLRRAAGVALADDAAQIGVEHVRRALGPDAAGSP
jgi:ATP-dependent Clp protease ATP-binding subunit ClpC